MVIVRTSPPKCESFCDEVETREEARYAFHKNVLNNELFEP